MKILKLRVFLFALALMKRKPLAQRPPPNTHRGFIIAIIILLSFSPLSSHFPVSILSCLGPESLSPLLKLFLEQGEL